MNPRAVIFCFVVLLAATLNFGFFVGDIADPGQHNAIELFAATAVNIVATGLKLGARTHLGAVHLATSLVADLQLVAASGSWVHASWIAAGGLTPTTTAVVVSLSGGALLANLVSVLLLVVETTSRPRSRSGGAPPPLGGSE